MEHFKSFENIQKEDERWHVFSQPETVPLFNIPFTFQYIYNNINSINLSDDVPDEIQSQFNIAKMIAVYSWF